MQTINELSLSKDLIKFPSITPVDAGAIKFLSKKLKSLGFKCKILEFKKGKGKPIRIFMPGWAINNLTYVMQVIRMSCHQVIIMIGL